MIDISDRIVEITIRGDGLVVWVNVDGECVLRACNIKKLEVNDERDYDEVTVEDQD